LDVLERNLAERQFLCGDDYTIADMANYGWYGALVLHNIYEAAEFLDVASYTEVTRWAKAIEARPAVQRGRRVNRPWGPEETQVRERHGPEDFK
ncbi:MAG: glutathione binding-like protein, partial [Gammaproteobacteria bacterium]|nr:glutathione binding-like protein [Gammaproteobacteria bacterium]